MTTEVSDYRKKVYQYFVNKTGNKNEANDLTQEVFVKLLKHWDQLQTIKDVSAWIFRISRNTLIDYYRKSNRSKEVVQVELEITQSNSQLIDESWMESMLECQETFLLHLDPQTSLLIRKADIEGISQKELAASTGIAYPTLRSKIQRGRSQLKQMFMDACDMEYDAAGHIVSCSHKSRCSSDC